ncbi:hypothetical protein NLJ89_g7989 [Agrocybe chaxingu]|uniref:Exocyst complex component Sec10-like alpha-helical bundle domain-containing protein n=1 Tax=Agrocybe chaxingu TaxID=84603 RepID=A0A9W8MSK1_9AGAR|nr:hypothetical protein NLJ89_g7989 [Agrocybe chaxingu]
MSVLIVEDSEQTPSASRPPTPSALGHNRRPVQTVQAAPAIMQANIIKHFFTGTGRAAYARCSHATAAIARKDGIWEPRWKALGVDRDPALSKVLDDLERRAAERASQSRASAPPTIAVDDDFGDFSGGTDALSLPLPEEMGDFVGAFQGISVSSPKTPSYSHQKESFKTKYARVHGLLKPLTRLLSSPPHVVLSDLAAQVTPSLYQEAKTLRLLSFFLSAAVQPVRKWDTLYLSLRTAMDRYDSNLLTAFDAADGKGDEAAMREAAESSWEVWDARSGDWEMGKVWAEKREIFYQQGNWRALDNFTKEEQLDFRAMDEFMDVILASIYEHGARAVRVFPPASQVLLLFSERLAHEVVGDYITTLLSHAREISTLTYMKSVAASFREAWRMVDAIMDVAKQREDSSVLRTKAEDVVYQMFEPHMDEYLDEEVEAIKLAFDTICKGWDKEVRTEPSCSVFPS